MNVTVGERVIHVGYQRVEGDGERPPYAQVRMTAIIAGIGERRPYPDNGETYGRLLCSPDRAITLLGWGEVARRQILLAVDIAREELSVPLCKSDEEIWI